MNVLLDTTALIDLERQNKTALSAMKKLVKHNLCISTVTANELYFGAAFSKRMNSLKNAVDLLNQFQFLDVDVHVALTAGALAAHSRINGKIRQKEDFLIAATLVTNKLDLLVTENKKYFSDIPELKGKVKSFADF